ncbi:MAG: hypothetical protein LBH44_06090 [Treponema sp.]|jgi:small-conductance mechanosensitive channel|nr:hypothetical protein [Treponema sp.]
MEENKKDKFVYLLILIVLAIIVFYLIIGFIFVEKESLEDMEETAGNFRGAPYSHGSFFMAIFIVPMIFVIIHCIRKIR